jgi:hypothetical protein
MPIHAPRIQWMPSIGLESGCQLVPEASRDIAYAPRKPVISMS